MDRAATWYGRGCVGGGEWGTEVRVHGEGLRKGPSRDD